MNQNSNRRVVITGAGLVSPLGCGLSDFHSGLRSRRSAIGPVRQFPVDSLSSPFGAEAWDFTGEIENFGPLDKLLQRAIKKGIKLMCREIQMGVAAAQLCLNHSGLDVSKRDPERTGVTFGSDYIMTVPGEFTNAIRQCLNDKGQFEFSRWGERGLANIDPLWLLKYLPNMPASHIAIYNDLRGPSNSITSREASSNLAIGEAFATIQRGSADAMIAGATGTRVHVLRTIHVYLQEQVARGDDPATLSRPFDLDRTGLVLGEGAGAILLEELSHARARNATIMGEVIGHASSTAMSRQGEVLTRQSIRNVLTHALRSSGLKPDDVGHIHAHGLSTRLGDAAEAQAIHDVFSGTDRPVPVTAAKSYFGNLGAGGGVVELIASLLSFTDGKLFPTLNYVTADPACPIAVAAEDGVPAGNSFVNVNVSPQGQAAAVVVQSS